MSKNSTQIIEKCREIKENWIDRVCPLSYIAHGIALYEGLAFASMVELFDAEIILESGIAGGRSTEMLARYFDIPIIAVDSGEFYGIDNLKLTKERLSKYENLSMVIGDSCRILPEIIYQMNDKRIAVLIDGPKMNLADFLAESCKGLGVEFAAIHDTCVAEFYHQLKDAFFYTDDEEFLNEFKDIEPENRTFGGLGFV